MTSLERPGQRFRIYALLGLGLFLLGLILVGFKSRFDLIASDGRFYYVYLPSLFIDGDLDFHNQIVEHWPVAEHPALGIDITAKGLEDNHYSIGVALTLSPVFLLAHGIAQASHTLTGWTAFTPDGYAPVYQILLFAWIVFLVVFTLAILDHLLVSAFAIPPVIVFASILLTFVGSPWLYYSFREPFMSHAIGTFWVTLTIALIWHCLTKLDQHRLPIGLGWCVLFTTSMAVICRPTNLLLTPFGMWLLWRIIREGFVLRLLCYVPLLITALWPGFLQMLTWYEMHGRFITYSYGPHHFDWGHPALWQTLFSSRHGLFFWSPLLLVSVLGVFLRFLRGGQGQGLLTCYCVSFLLLWYSNSCWCYWWFGDSCGARAFTELAGMFAVGVATVLVGLQHVSLPTRRLVAGIVAITVLINLALMGGYVLHLIARGDYLIQGF